MDIACIFAKKSPPQLIAIFCHYITLVRKKMLKKGEYL